MLFLKMSSTVLCLILTAVFQTEERKDELERRESETEGLKEREDMADEERQGEDTSELLKELKRKDILLNKNRAAIRKLKKENAVLKRKMKIKDRKFRKMLNEDQIVAIGRLSTKGMKWSTETVKKALKLRFAAGSSGYKALQDLQIPLPGIRTLERECVLTIDEMAITSSVELHTLSGKLYGDVTLPGHTGVATHACVFMLAGSTTRWKQVVAYHFSGNYG